MPSPTDLNVLVLAHNLADAAIARRVSMLRQGGASVTVAGFRRTDVPPASVEGCPAIDFGQTYDYGFLQRISSVLRIILGIKRHRKIFAEANLIVARNLEMLAIGVRGRSIASTNPVLVYECLDIHRLLLRRDIAGSLLRYVEGWLSRRASALLTSSPAFLSHYFQARSSVTLPIRIVENKMAAEAASQPVPRKSGPPWIIGWFGVIRCSKSLAILRDLVRRSAGQIEVIIRGRPDPVPFDDFERDTTDLPGLRYLGPYRYPQDLAAMYNEVHFTWAIDMFEEGLNSSWLLPNRLYEGGAFGSVPIARSTVETGRFLERLGIGVSLPDPLPASLEAFFTSLTPERYGALEQAVMDVPRRTWLYDTAECRDLVDYLRSLQAPA